MPSLISTIRRFRLTALTGLTAALCIAATGCPIPPPDNTGVFNNTTDPTNNGASFVGSAACLTCHSNLIDTAGVHAHRSALNPIDGAPPEYPEIATRAGVPDPPAGFEWTDIAFVIGGYAKGAFFVNQDGFLLTDGVTGVDTNWRLDFPPNGATPSFADYLPGAAEPPPYDFDCFRCHTTGALPFDPDSPMFQGGREGMPGTFVEAGVGCEACHGPGANHIPNPQARDLFVDTGSSTCVRCHTNGDDAEVIPAENGFIAPNSQYNELRASGGHAAFDCGFCHDPHVSTSYAPEQAIRNDCAACHPNQNMALHEGLVFTRGDYTEPLSCESCHMPWAGRSNSSADSDIVGALGRMGDIRSHIFRISTEIEDFNDMFTGGSVTTDAQGRAAITVDFVCLRCHTQPDAIDNTAFPLDVEFASEIAIGMHSGGDVNGN